MHPIVKNKIRDVICLQFIENFFNKINKATYSNLILAISIILFLSLYYLLLRVITYPFYLINKYIRKKSIDPLDILIQPEYVSKEDLIIYNRTKKLKSIK